MSGHDLGVERDGHLNSYIREEFHAKNRKATIDSDCQKRCGMGMKMNG